LYTEWPWATVWSSRSPIESIDDPRLFAQFFRKPESWKAWRCFLAVLFGIPLDQNQRRLFKQCTACAQPLQDGYREAWLCIGRRGGKSFLACSPVCPKS